MKKRILLGAGALLLALTALFVFNTTPASAHNADSYSFFYCGATRPDNYYGDHMTIYHSSPVDFPQPGWVRYYCYGNWSAYDYDYQWWVDVRVSDGGWVIPYNYQDCDLINCALTAGSYGH